jgi:PAS domain S-box-containing protein
MNNNQNIKTMILGENQNQLRVLVIAGFLLGLLFMIFFWMLAFSGSPVPVSFAGLCRLHMVFPSLWLSDMIPFVAGACTWFFSRIWIKEKNTYETQIRNGLERIERNADFAQKIGEGKFDANFEPEESDTLGRSLVIMRDNLLSNNKKESEQNWIAEGKEIVSNILRIHNKIDELSYQVIINLIRYINAVQGALYIFDEEQNRLLNVATYAYNRKKYVNQEFKIGQGLIGQCAYEMDIIYRTEIPDDYATITSGILGDQKPCSILIVPLISDEKLQGVIEIASLERAIPDRTIKFMRELGEIIARTIFNLRINQKTERLLLEAQQMTTELQENEEQLRQNAEEMRATQEELQRSNEQLESKISEVENAQKRLNALLENASEIITIYNENLSITYQSPSVKKILGYTAEEMMHGKDFDRLTRKGEIEMRMLFNKLIENPEEPVTIQYTFLKKDGDKIFLETTGRNLMKDSAIRGFLLNSQDITERRRAEKEERMRSRMQSLSENSMDIIIRLSTDGIFFYVNPIVEKYLGYEPKDMINKTTKGIDMDEGLRTYFEEMLKRIKGKPEKVNTEIKIPLVSVSQTDIRIISFDAIPEFNENELETVLFVGHDITEAKRIELEIQDKNKKIEDSINYAQRIQTSILPDNRLIREYLPKSFIFYKPRDVVSGDFPWFFLKDDIIHIAAVDCTGHGVPGALLSFIGYFILNNVVDHDREMTAGEICDLLHYGVRTTLKQDREDANGRDGMDIAFCRINQKKKELQFSGAHRPLYLLRKGELTEYKGDRKAIGGIPLGRGEEQPFTNYTIPYLDGDKIFFFSDGLPDQLGGEEKKKYSPKRIRELILSNQSVSMMEFNEIFAHDFEVWKNGSKQIDDVLMIGIEF